MLKKSSLLVVNGGGHLGDYDAKSKQELQDNEDDPPLWPEARELNKEGKLGIPLEREIAPDNAQTLFPKGWYGCDECDD
jgi:hypothetical protein